MIGLLKKHWLIIISFFSKAQQPEASTLGAYDQPCPNNNKSKNIT
jgi:hypothetical protein